MSGAELGFESPRTVEGALELLAGSGDALVMAGGTSVVLMLKKRLVTPRLLVWLGRVGALKGVRVGPDGSASIGALTTLRETASSAALSRVHRGLRDAAASVGNERVRSVATVGGAVVHGEPRQDVPPVLLALNASAVIRGPDGSREVPLRDFYTGFLATTLDDDREILTHVRIPPARNRTVVYMRFAPASRNDSPTVGVAASATFSRLGRITDAAVAVAGAGPVPLHVPEVAEILSGSRRTSADVHAVAAAAMQAARPTADRFGSADYKREMVGVWTQRAVQRCLRDSADRR